MSAQNSAIPSRAVSPVWPGTALAALGVLAFSFSLPATAWTLDGFGPWTTTGLRGCLAAAIAAAALAATRTALPEPRYWPALLVVALGCVLGFPLLSTLALHTSSTAHSAVIIGTLPMATAACAALRSRRRPPATFWLAASIGAALVIGFALAQSHGQPTLGDACIVGAVLVCAAGYAEGGRLSAHLPPWAVIAWAVVLAAPVSAVGTVVALGHEPIQWTPRSLVGLAYVAAISQFGGFIAWYGGMARIGVPRASQLQLAQPLLTVIWAVLLLGERPSLLVPLTAMAVLVCIVVTQRAR